MSGKFFAVAIAVSVCCVAFAQWAGNLPTGRTPGVVLDTDPDVVCADDYLSLRGTSAPELEQRKAFFRYAVPWELRDSYQADHLIPVELGGSHDTHNLWPQHINPSFSYNAKFKDALERKMRKEVCVDHTITLEAAQIEIRANWIEAFKRRFAVRPKL